MQQQSLFLLCLSLVTVAVGTADKYLVPREPLCGNVLASSLKVRFCMKIQQVKGASQQINLTDKDVLKLPWHSYSGNIPKWGFSSMNGIDFWNYLGSQFFCLKLIFIWQSKIHTVRVSIMNLLLGSTVLRGGGI